MRRADRLFQIIQIVRGARRPVTAAQLADELELTRRTIYRDVADLVGSGVPIRGEAGVGYVLEAGYELPPLMLTANELEAALLGAQWVFGRGDPTLALAARDLVAKLRAVAPPDLLFLAAHSSVVAPNLVTGKADIVDLQRVRDAIQGRLKLILNYSDESGKQSVRTIWPIFVAYLEAARLIVGWCELRGAFRHFRTDRVQEITYTKNHFETPLPNLRKAWEAQEKAKGDLTYPLPCRLL